MSTTHAHAAPDRYVQDAVPSDGLELARPTQRLGAFFADWVAAAVMILLPASIVMLTTKLGGQREVVAALTQTKTAGLLVATGFIAWSWITALLVARNGQTIGKRLFEIKVVRSDGSPASLGRIFWLRNFVNFFLGAIPFYALVDVLFVLGPRRRCIHDLLADTIVVMA